MSDFRFILINNQGDELIAEPLPTGWNDPTIVLERDTDWHGMFFDYGLDLLTFTGEAAGWLKDEYDERGVDGQMNLRVEFLCSENGPYDLLYEGKVAFDARYKEVCGEECSVTIAIEDSNDVMAFKNNYEQKVNLNSNIAFDQETELSNYEGLNFGMEIPGRGLMQKIAGESIDQQHPFYPIDITWPSISNAIYIRPVFTQNIVSEIETADLAGGSAYSINQDLLIHPTVLSPILELTLTPTCNSGVFDYSVRMKGHFRETTNGNRTMTVQAVVTNLPTYTNVGSPALAKQTLLPSTAYTNLNGPDFDYDASFSGQCVLSDGDGFRAFIFVAYTMAASTRTSLVYVDWEQETNVSLKAVTQCPPSTSKMYMINEATSRVVEAITNNQIKFYSSIFGRQDSQPYSLSNNPCQGMFGITSGLNIRRKKLADNTQPGFFVSMGDIFDGINPMWNIGLFIEPDPNRPGFKRLRFEDSEFFYRNELGLTFRHTNRVEKTIDISRIFNRAKVGYNKWEAEQYTGLDEFMTLRTYRLNINTLSAEKNLTTNVICSPYTIEITRRLDATTEDWKYDNDIFGFCMRRSDNPIFGAPDVQVETFADGVIGVENILDSTTCYNGRVSPIRMAMRWFNNLMQGLRQVTSETKLIFTEGVGNYIAKFRLNNCDIAGSPIRENDDVDITDFADPVDAQPIVFPELDVFQHPMNYNVFKRLKDDPTLMYKSIQYNCGSQTREGWIKRVSYRLIGGMAEITVIPKNDLQIPTPEPPCNAMILDGSITAVESDTVPGQFSIDFTEQVAGGDNWAYEIINLGDPDISFSGSVNTHPFVVTGITVTGDYRITIIPYCGVRIGQNVGVTQFSVSEPLLIQLSAILTNTPPNYKLRLTATGNIPAPAAFSFKFGQCVTNTSSGIMYCEGFVGGLDPGSYATMSFSMGDTTENQDSTVNTAGPTFGTINKIVLFDLVGITSAQISKAAGQTWTLVFQ